MPIFYFVCLTYGVFFFKPIINHWFSLFLFFLGNVQIFVSICFRRDSSMLFAFCCYASFLADFFVCFFFIKQSQIIVYFFMYCIAFFVLYLIFRQNIHLKMFAIVFCQVLLLVVTKTTNIHGILFWCIQIAYIVLILGIFLIYLCRTKESKGGIRNRKKWFQKTRS